MVSKSFDARVPVKGKVRVCNLSGTGCTPYSDSSTFQSGWSGSMDSVNHPRPYVLGGPWGMVKTLTVPAIVDGKLRTGTQTEYSLYPISAWSATNEIVVSPTDDINTLLARSNPSKPIVSLPNFFAELGDIPELVKDAGKNLIKRQAKGNLNLEFGWKLLFSDLMKLNMFGSLVDKRIEHLSHMYKRGGMKAKGGGRMDLRNVRDNPVNLAPYSVVRNHVSSCHAWYSYSWIPLGDLRLSYPTYEGYRWKVFMDSLGDAPNIGLLWDAIPWSWLVDWFATVGDTLWAQANSLGFIPGQCFKMTEQTAETIETITPFANFSGSITPAHYKVIRKSRSVVIPGTATADLPILSNKQIGILASLTVLRAR
jgi:hypothetical protein